MANVCLASCQKLATQIEHTKKNLLAELRETFEVPEQLFRLALGEAEALAWQTDYPHLVFPDLATEKIQSVAAWHARQQSLVRRGFASQLAA
ncbi:MAG TPA: hypothetical protein VMB80_05165 [Candidatus Acidoferrum sp.]|nr:hypothetical protein [Candidatus Acidoferrum sp.]